MEDNIDFFALGMPIEDAIRCNKQPSIEECSPVIQNGINERDSSKARILYMAGA